ncbi:hypothetical protein TIFTF001_013922 [Ficus carica]|uniref:Uncharacterized protein n=1 Tax=Ficus carica TaxID=3494 RepID=A0AA88A563_FICCA|nr:hypothetical protein TIFTF001_013922 [Ficus carica]
MSFIIAGDSLLWCPDLEQHIIGHNKRVYVGLRYGYVMITCQVHGYVMRLSFVLFGVVDVYVVLAERKLTSYVYVVANTLS